jgi:hypothetical protein
MLLGIVLGRLAVLLLVLSVIPFSKIRVVNLEYFKGRLYLLVVPAVNNVVSFAVLFGIKVFLDRE